MTAPTTARRTVRDAMTTDVVTVHPDDPFKQVVQVLAEREIAVTPGQWISSGAVTGVHDARPGQTVEGRFNDYTVKCELVEAQPE